MKKTWIWLALAALILPLLARGLWFYRGFPPRREAIQTPDYQALRPARMPLQTPEGQEAKIKQTPGVILVDYAHGNQFQPHEIQSLREALEARGGTLEALTDSALLEAKLKYAAAYLVVSPSVMFTADENFILDRFVSRGGRLLVFTDATRGMVYSDYFSGTIAYYSDSNAANSLLAPHGITVNNDYLYNVRKNDGNFRNVFFEKFGKDELAFGLKQVAFYGTHSLQAPEGTVLLRGDENARSSIDDAHHPEAGGAALSADGSVLAFGDFTFLTSPYFRAADNATLIANIADFALGGKRLISLENYPFVFPSGKVSLYPAFDPDTPLTVEAVSAVSGLQKTLSATGVSLEIVGEAPREGDLIVLGFFDGGDLLAEFLKPFDVTLPMEGEEYVYVKSLAPVGRYGNALLLFDQTKKGVRLTLLADTPEDLVALIGTLSGGSLDGCVLQGDVAVCGVGYGGDYSGGEATEEPAPEGEATPEAQGNG